MKIGIDMQSTVASKTGIGHYTSQLVKKLISIDRTNSYNFLRCNRFWSERVPRRLIWENIEIPRQAKQIKLDLLHVPGFASPYSCPCPIIVTVHDLIGMIFPKNLGLFSRFYWSKWLPFVVKRADVILASSENTKKDIQRLLGVNPENIKVVYLGVGKHFIPKKEKEISQVKNKYGISNDYVLHVGAVEPRKNIERLIVAFKKAKAKVGKDIKLVIAGKKEWAYEKVLSTIKKEALQNDVIFSGYIEDADLPAIYSGASVLAFPSLYEGFGLPLVEAMACGTPIVASNISSVPEIAKEAAILVDPYNEEDLSEALVSVLSDQKLKDSLTQKGHKRVSEFSWDKTAQEVLKEYQNLFQKRSA